MSESAQNLDTSQFQALTSTEGVYLIDFWAEWCPPCRAMAPIIEQVAPTIPQVNFVKINIDENQELAGQLNIISIPTFLLIKFDGSGKFDPSKNILKKLIGAVPPLDFKMQIEKALEENGIK